MPHAVHQRLLGHDVAVLLGQGHEEAKRLLTAHRKQLDALAQALLSRETLNEQEILQVTGLPPAPPLEAARSRAASKAS
jgi:cell division protease FtsH